MITSSSPAALREIEARIRAPIRRAQGGSETTLLQVGDLRFDTGSMRIERAAQQISLAPVPARIPPGIDAPLSQRRASPRNQPRDLGADDPAQGESHALIVHMHALRAAVDKPFERQLIHTVRGFGLSDPAR